MEGIPGASTTVGVEQIYQGSFSPHKGSVPRTACWERVYNLSFLSYGYHKILWLKLVLKGLILAHSSGVQSIAVGTLRQQYLK